MLTKKLIVTTPIVTSPYKTNISPDPLIAHINTFYVISDDYMTIKYKNTALPIKVRWCLQIEKRLPICMVIT